MNTLTTALRSAAFAAALMLLPALVSAADTASDHAAEVLALRGSVPVKNAGPLVEAGSPLVQVTLALGMPSARLEDGTLLYRNYEVLNSAAVGTLVIHFNEGRVSKLTLVKPAIAVAMSTSPSMAGKVLVATAK